MIFTSFFHVQTGSEGTAYEPMSRCCTPPLHPAAGVWVQDHHRSEGLCQYNIKVYVLMNGVIGGENEASTCVHMLS